MSERKFDMNRDGLGILLFVAGVLPAVLLVVAMRKSEPLESMTGTGALAAMWLTTIGAVPSLLLTVGVAFLGARLYLFGKNEGLLRNVIGLAGTALGLAILLGAFSATAGGHIGYAIGGLVSSMTHVAVGAVIGLIALAAPIWFTWLREEREPRIAADPESGAGEVLGEEIDDGVSAEEAKALIPEDFNHAIDEGRKQLAERPIRSAPPPSPYPEDVRLKGQIPAGARPLNAEPDVRTEPESAPQPSSVYRWTAPRADVPADGVDEDLVIASDAEVVFAAEPVVAERTWRDSDGIADAELPAEPIRPVVEAIGSEIELTHSPTEFAGTAAITTLADALAEPLNELPRPSWEQSSLFTEGDEPVDAYGTPLTLVDALRQDGGADTITSEAVTAASEYVPEPAVAVPTETDFAPELEQGGEDEIDVHGADVRPALVDEMETDGEDSEELEDDDALGEDLEESADEVEASEDEEDEEDLEEEEALDDEDEAALDEDDEFDEEEEGDTEEIEELETVAVSHDVEAIEQTKDAATARGVEIEIEPVQAAAPAAASMARDKDVGSARDPIEVTAAGTPSSRGKTPVESPLFDLIEQRTRSTIPAPVRIDRLAPSPAASAPSLEKATDSEIGSSTKSTRREVASDGGERAERGARASKRGEREIVLQPRATPPEKAIKSQAVIPERAELLRDAGCLFVDRGRVAVSMLQRQYGMDFDEACKVLDELQNLGLIGPYLGGQRRDILLTREQWLEKVGSA